MTQEELEIYINDILERVEIYGKFNRGKIRANIHQWLYI